MFDKLSQLEDKYNDLTKKLSDPEVIADPNSFQKFAKAHAELEEIMTVYREYKEVAAGIAEAKELLADELEPDFRAMVQEELKELEPTEKLQEQLKIMLLPKDLMTRKTLLLRYGLVQAGKKQPYLQGSV